MLSTITPCLWFDRQAEDAANYYVSIFKNSRVTEITHYPGKGHEIHRGREGTVLTVVFELEGKSFTALNAGPQFSFTEAVSFQIECETQEEVDYYWEKLAAGGPVEAGGAQEDGGDAQRS